VATLQLFDGNDLFTTMFTAQMGRGKIQWGAFTSRKVANKIQSSSRQYIFRQGESQLQNVHNRPL
jgi:hypothetical protein